MTNHLKTLDYFKSSLLDVFFSLPEILNDPNHSQYSNLMMDINNINPTELDSYVRENKIDMFLGRYENKHIGRCTFFLTNKIQNEIAKERLSKLTELSTKLAPYDSKNLSQLEIQDNHLVFAQDFKPFGTGFKFNDFVYHLTPTTDASNSSYWLTEVIMNLSFKEGFKFKIRLDPFIEEHYSTYNPMFFIMDVYGKKLDWERLKSLKEDEHGRWMDEKSYSHIGITDYVWRPDGKEIHFTMEELPKIENLCIRGSRYFHSIFDKATGLVKHCDGAIRFYSIEEYNHRINFHVRNPEVRKIGRRIKVFQLDENIDKERFGLLATNFMVWNHDVLNYFN